MYIHICVCVVVCVYVHENICLHIYIYLRISLHISIAKLYIESSFFCRVRSSTMVKPSDPLCMSLNN